ncbi:epoxide hydrolase 1-like [Silene latifolia]|uniref:epoxide hydrolase 1-like n=1 Tax=Silene latifolia TaxID=37657 RepID=UPI003D775AC3
MDLVTPSAPLPPWFSDEDLEVYGSLYENSGFQTALQVPYRSTTETYDILDPILRQPALLIMGRKDYFFKFPGIQENIESGKVKEFAPDLTIIYVPEGTHFVHEQFPEVVNELILDFLADHP